MKSHFVDHVFSLLSLVLEAPDYTKEFRKSPISSRVLVLLETWRRKHRVGARCFTDQLPFTATLPTGDLTLYSWDCVYILVVDLVFHDLYGQTICFYEKRNKVLPSGRR